MGKRTLEGDDLAFLACYPRKGSDVAMMAVVGGTGLAGMRTTDHLPYFEEIHELLKKDERFDEIESFQPDEEERTDFELIFSHKQIGRCSFEKRSNGVVE